VSIVSLLLFVIGIPLAFAILAGVVLLALKLGMIVFKAMEKPDHGESDRYRLEQGREVDER
jgi:uncharacterized membrane protein YwaF